MTTHHRQQWFFVVLGLVILGLVTVVVVLWQQRAQLTTTVASQDVRLQTAQQDLAAAMHSLDAKAAALDTCAQRQATLQANNDDCNNKLADAQKIAAFYEQRNKDALQSAIAQEAATLHTAQQENALHQVNAATSFDNFQFILNRAGFVSGKYRVEFFIKNTGTTLDYFQPSGIAIIDGTNQYDVTMSTTSPVDTLSTAINPGIVKQASWEFDGVPTTPNKNGKFVFTTGFVDKNAATFSVPLY
jgi:archaellum component FlaG (FlaF/FlaG flagellin family)